MLDTNPLSRLQIAAPADADAITIIEALTHERPLKPFDEAVLAFLNALSKGIMRNPSFRTHPETVAFAYWIRGQRLKQLETEFRALPTTGILTARGLAFHVAPANVDTIFLYSLVLSMLVGNCNIVRISSRRNANLDLLIDQINALLAKPEHDPIRRRVAIVRYEHDAEVSGRLSQLCDLRVMWGGDSTINAFRTLPLPPRATELCFPDKLSMAVFDGAAVLTETDLISVAHNFVNDAYWFGQMACSSPRMVIWRANEETARRAAKRFWDAVEQAIAVAGPDLSASDFMNKLVAEQSYAAVLPARIRPASDNRLSVVDVPLASKPDFSDHCGGGLFLQSRIDCLADLTPILTRRNQTLVSYGVTRDEWLAWMALERPRGVDRIVPVGQALDFATVWDGYDLPRAFSREVSVRS